MWLLTGCTDDDRNGRTVTTDTYNVAVVVPMNGSLESQWRMTIDWALQSIERAQQTCQNRVKLNVELYNEDQVDIENLAQELGQRDDVRCVIGPVNQDRLDTMARYIKGKGKPLIAISAGSTDVVRKYVEKRDFFWAMTQTDISQCEAMLASAAQMGRRQFSLVCNDICLMGQTFKDWFVFQATELGLDVTEAHFYSSEADIPGLIQESIPTISGGKHALVCVPANEQEARSMLLEINSVMAQLSPEDKPLVYVSSDVVQMDLSDMNLDFNYMVVYPSVDPQSGFYSGFYAHTGKTICTFEPQLYDALMLSAMGLAKDASDLKSGMISVTSQEGAELYAWNVEGMQTVFSEIEQGIAGHHICGASSNLRMDQDNHTCVTASHYILYYNTDGTNYAPISFYSPRKAGQSNSTLSDWKWQATNVPEIAASMRTFNYPELHDRWAVVVAASQGFANYRHQADALNIYQYLRSNGFTDDHILLIMADDIAYNPLNKQAGMVSVSVDGENLYHDVAVDHHVADLTAQQVLDRISDLPSTANDDVFVFWSGHGTAMGMNWGKEEIITPAMVRSLVSGMNGRYRKMMWCIEACYSGVIGQGIEGLPGVIMLTAANANETSKADTYNPDLEVWMSNRFSIYLIESLKAELLNQGDITVREMFYYLSSHVIGSHVSLYNYTNYDDITKAGFREYIK